MCLSCHRTKEKHLFQHRNAIEKNQKIKENKTEPTRTMQPIKPPIESNVRWEMHLHFKINCSFFFIRDKSDRPPKSQYAYEYSHFSDGV